LPYCLLQALPCGCSCIRYKHVRLGPHFLNSQALRWVTFFKLEEEDNGRLRLAAVSLSCLNGVMK
jgi:hypothetical protein